MLRVTNLESFNANLVVKFALEILHNYETEWKFTFPLSFDFTKVAKSFYPHNLSKISNFANSEYYTTNFSYFKTNLTFSEFHNKKNSTIKVSHELSKEIA